MKKKLTLLILFIIAIMCLGCEPALKKYDPFISEIRSNLYEGNAGEISVEAITGYREEPFEINGFTSTKQEFTVITISPSSYKASAKYTYKALIDDTEYSGDMVKHPFNNTYSVEIHTLTISNEIDFTVTYEGKTNNAKLASIVGENFISAEKALEIATKKLNSGMRTLKNNGISYEIYIRLLKNPVSSSGGYHWYVAFVGENEVTYAVLIDPISLEIVAIRD